MNHKGILSFLFSDYNQEVMPTSCNEPKSALSPVITTKKLYPLLAMNPKAVSLLDPVINQEANPLLAMNPKAVSLLSPMFN